jgi:hypothetical protein
MNPRLKDMCKAEIHSKADDMAISMKRQYSLFDVLPDPSAIFNDMETLALLNWLVIPYISSLGNDEVS